MIILPPPPKYYSTGGLPGNLPALEATNSRTILDKKVQSFSAPEGTYSAVDYIFLATPLPHPSDPPPIVINPLAPTVNLPSSQSSGVRLSVTSLKRSTLPSQVPSQSSSSSFAKKTNPLYQQNASKTSFGGWTSSLFSQTPSARRPEQNSATASNSDVAAMSTSTLASQESSTPLHTALFVATGSVPPQSDPKKRKPKNSLSKNNSSFISRTIVHESTQRRVQDHPVDDVFVWANVGRSLSWLDMSSLSPTTKHEPLSKILFTKSHPLCHDVNLVNLSVQNMEVVIGTSSGDAIWIDSVSNRYNRINKKGEVSKSAITAIKWVPKSDNFFITAHADGSLAIFEKDREDGALEGAAATNQDPRSTDTFKIIKSYHNTPGAARQNPIAVYKLSNSPLTSLEFSPDGSILAITGNDGYLRFVDLSNEQMLDIFPSYYGGFICSSFSPDGQFIATGGQDDMVSIYSIATKSLVARLQGHTSWVRQVRFDPWTTDSENYRLGSAGEDGSLRLWDFSPKALTRPKNASHQLTLSSAKTLSGANDEPATEKEPQAKVQQARTKSKRHAHLHHMVSQNDSPIVFPVVTKSVHVNEAEPEPLSDLVFLEKYIMLVGKDGRLWTWERPTARG